MSNTLSAPLHSLSSPLLLAQVFTYAVFHSMSQVTSMVCRPKLHVMQVHYGRASMSPLSCLPAYFVFGQQPLDVQATAEHIAGCASQHGSEHKTALVFMDQLLLHAASQLQAHVQQIQQVGTAFLYILCLITLMTQLAAGSAGCVLPQTDN